MLASPNQPKSLQPAVVSFRRTPGAGKGPDIFPGGCIRGIRKPSPDTHQILTALVRKGQWPGSEPKENVRIERKGFFSLGRGVRAGMPAAGPLPAKAPP